MTRRKLITDAEKMKKIKDTIQQLYPEAKIVQFETNLTTGTTYIKVSYTEGMYASSFRDEQTIHHNSGNK